MAFSLKHIFVIFICGIDLIFWQVLHKLLKILWSLLREINVYDCLVFKLLFVAFVTTFYQVCDAFILVMRWLLFFFIFIVFSLFLFVSVFPLIGRWLKLHFRYVFIEWFIFPYFLFDCLIIFFILSFFPTM
jgi:hypothetical protein